MSPTNTPCARTVSPYVVNDSCRVAARRSLSRVACDSYSEILDIALPDPSTSDTFVSLQPEDVEIRHGVEHAPRNHAPAGVH